MWFNEFWLCIRWYVLEREGGRGLFLGWIYFCFCFDGGYYVMDELLNYISDIWFIVR